MIKYIFVFALSTMLISCGSDESPESLSITVVAPERTFVLTEDLGSSWCGNATSYVEKHDQRLFFYEDGSFESNGDICDWAYETIGPSSGTYSFEEGSLSVDGCDPLKIELAEAINSDDGLAAMRIDYPLAPDDIWGARIYIEEID